MVLGGINTSNVDEDGEDPHFVCILRIRRLLTALYLSSWTLSSITSIASARKEQMLSL